MKIILSPGLILCALFGLFATFMAQQSISIKMGLSAMPIAILLGLILANIAPKLTHYPSIELGLNICKKQILRLGIILYGFKITLIDLQLLGLKGFLYALLMLISCLILSLVLNRLFFKMPVERALLVGIGSSVCGAAAIIGANSVMRAKDSDVAIAVSTVVMYGSLSIFIYPFFEPWLLKAWFTSHQLGVYIGASVHEVGQVIAIASTLGDEVTNMAVITKMSRVMMLAPLILLLPLGLQSFSDKKDPSKNIPVRSSSFLKYIPWFAVLFILTIGLNTLLSSYLSSEFFNPIKSIILQLDAFLLVMAMFALGLSIHFKTLLNSGGSAFKLAGLLWIYLMIFGLIIGKFILN